MEDFRAGEKARRTRPRPRPATWGRREGAGQQGGRGRSYRCSRSPHLERTGPEPEEADPAEACEPLQLSRRESGPTGQRAQTLQMGTAAGRGLRRGPRGGGGRRDGDPAGDRGAGRCRPGSPSPPASPGTCYGRRAQGGCPGGAGGGSCL